MSYRLGIMNIVLAFGVSLALRERVRVRAVY